MHSQEKCIWVDMKKNKTYQQGLKPSSGWARPIKYKKKNYRLTASGFWDIVGLMSSFDIFPLGKLAKVSQQRKEKMKEIIVRGKKVKVPFEDADYRLDGDKDVEIQNPFSGEKATVPGYAAAVYDVIQGAQVTHDYDLVQKGCDWFSRNFPKQYMVLLD